MTRRATRRSPLSSGFAASFLQPVDQAGLVLVGSRGHLLPHPFETHGLLLLLLGRHRAPRWNPVQEKDERLRRQWRGQPLVPACELREAVGHVAPGQFLAQPVQLVVVEIITPAVANTAEGSLFRRRSPIPRAARYHARDPAGLGPCRARRAPPDSPAA